MKLVSVHIENFGKLHDRSFEFSEGANMIREDNGWGKSTLTAFIRAMFYGLGGDRKRSIEENERKRYLPWQGGVFGGELVFLSGGKTYRITRIFKDKETNDEFELRDAATNLPSHDFSADIGEELFGINREAFLKTVFVEQNMCETAPNDDVNAKIGQLSYNSNDLNSYEDAISRLNAVMSSLTPHRVTGSLSKRKNEITEYERRVRAGEQIPTAMEKCESFLSDARGRQERMETRLKEISEMREKALIQERTIERKSRWEKLKETLLKKTAEKNRFEKRFPGMIPTAGDIVDKLSECRSMEKAFQRMEIYRLSPEEQEEYDSLTLSFAGGAPSDSDIVRMLDEATVFGNLNREAKEALAELRRQRQKRTAAFLTAGGLVLIAGLIVSVRFLSAGLLGAVLGALLAGYGVWQSGKEDVVPQEILLRIESSGETIANFLSRYGMKSCDADFARDLYKLSDAAKTYRALAGRTSGFVDASLDYHELRDRIDIFLGACGYEAGGDELQKLEEIRGIEAGYRQSLKACADAKTELEHFEASYPVVELAGFRIDETLPSVESLDRDYGELSRKIDAIHDDIDNYNKNLNDLGERLDQWHEDSERLKELRSLETEEQARYSLVSKAAEKLESAKEAMTARYAEPIRRSFVRCYEMLTGDSAEKFHIDANTKVTIEEFGTQRNTDTLSSGYRDLVGLCLRIALVDAMYQDEKPLLIMDDPFANLDDDKVELGMKFLTRLARTHQIIYLTCSASRCIGRGHFSGP